MSKTTKIIFAVLITIMLLMNGAVAKSEQQEHTQDHTDDQKGCDDGSDENVKEEVVGFSPDGTDILIKRVTSNPAKTKVQTEKGKPTNQCYKLMGIKWATQNVPYVINPAGSDAIAAAFTTSTGTWDVATSWSLFGAATVDNTAVYGFDGRNTLFFGSSLGSGIIAQTTTWYYYGSRQIVEFDIEFNNYFPWGDASADPTKMDAQEIATHELGHGIGLSDIYTTTCKDVTMYGYATNGEIKKRTLESGDLNGLWKIYGR